MKKLVLLLVVALTMLTGCRTTKESTSYVERERIENMMLKMDSVMHVKQTVQQDSSWHQTVIKQLQSIKERNDTSHTVVVDSSGKVIKETTIIYRDRESVSESEKEEREVMIHRLESLDSTVSSMTRQIEHYDSIMKASTSEVVIEKQEPWILRFFNDCKMVFLGAILGIAIIFVRKLLKAKD